MEAFTHFIITRFNVPTSFGPPQGWLDNKWLESRIQLFRQVCLPSILAQRNQNFTWLVLMSDQTPCYFREEVIKMISGQSFVGEVLLISERYEIALRLEMQRRKLCGTPYLLTTRLDSDDALCRGFVSTLQSTVCDQDYTFVSFSEGFTFSIETLELRKYIFPTNPFASLIEVWTESSTTIYCASHMNLPNLGRFISIPLFSAWLQCIHGGNVLNTPQGTLVPEPSTLIEREFSLSISQFTKS